MLSVPHPISLRRKSTTTIVIRSRADRECSQYFVSVTVHGLLWPNLMRKNSWFGTQFKKISYFLYTMDPHGMRCDLQHGLWPCAAACRLPPGMKAQIWSSASPQCWRNQQPWSQREDRTSEQWRRQVLEVGSKGGLGLPAESTVDPRWGSGKLKQCANLKGTTASYICTFYVFWCAYTILTRPGLHY